MKKLWKILGILMAVPAVMVLVAWLGLRLYCNMPQDNPSGVLLAFDDYYAENWEQYFDLFDEYDARVTFFVNAAEPTEFCYRAMERGHEIGFHTMEHMDMTTATEEELLEQAIEPLQDFRAGGIELTTFAYPYGSYTEEINQKLLAYYKVLRGGFYYELVSREDMKTGFVEAKPLDNNKFTSELQFRWVINKMLYAARFKEGVVLPIYSHGIEYGETCIIPERLEYILKKARELNLEFYTYQDLQ